MEPARGVATDLVGGDGRLWTPGVRVGVQPGSWFHRTECFGPVLGVMRADDLDHAIELQNGTDFGLTGGRRVRVVQHGGTINGFAAGFWRIPADGAAVVVLDNTMSPATPALTRALAEALYAADAGPR